MPLKGGALPHTTCLGNWAIIAHLIAQLPMAVPGSLIGHILIVLAPGCAIPSVRPKVCEANQPLGRDTRESDPSEFFR
jgi:hypothetical protein